MKSNLFERVIREAEDEDYDELGLPDPGQERDWHRIDDTYSEPPAYAQPDRDKRTREAKKEENYSALFERVVREAEDWPGEELDDFDLDTDEDDFGDEEEVDFDAVDDYFTQVTDDLTDAAGHMKNSGCDEQEGLGDIVDDVNDLFAKVAKECEEEEEGDDFEEEDDFEEDDFEEEEDDFEDDED